MKKKLWIVPIAVAVIGLLAWLMWYKATKPTEAQSNKLNDEDFVLSLMPCTVMINAGEEQGSGIIFDISDDLVTIVTAGHLMEGYQQGIITFSTGNAGFGNVQYVSQNPDLCIMTFSTSYIDDSLLQQLSAALNDNEHFRTLETDDEVFIVGSVQNAGSNATKGRVAAKDFYVDDFDARMIYLYADVVAGMSGCGVYDQDGFLLGIIVGGNDNGEAVAVPLIQIYEKYEVIKDDKN